MVDIGSKVITKEACSLIYVGQIHESIMLPQPIKYPELDVDENVVKRSLNVTIRETHSHKLHP